MVQIDKGVPIPESRKGAGKYPWRACEVGDSFVFSGTQSQAGRSAWTAGTTLGRRFATRKQPDGSVRIWRVA